MDPDKALPSTSNKWFGYRNRSDDDLLAQNNPPPADTGSHSPRLTLTRRRFFAVPERNEDGKLDLDEGLTSTVEDSISSEKSLPTFPPKYNPRRRGSLDTELTAYLNRGAEGNCLQEKLKESGDSIEDGPGFRRRGSVDLFKEGLDSPKLLSSSETQENALQTVKVGSPMKDLDLLSSIRKFHERQHLQSSFWTDTAVDSPGNSSINKFRTGKRLSLPVLDVPPLIPAALEGQVQKQPHPATKTIEPLSKPSILDKVSGMGPASDKFKQPSVPGANSSTEIKRGPISGLLFGSTKEKTTVKKRDMNAFSPSSW